MMKDQVSGGITNAGTLEIKRDISENYTNELLELLKTIKLERYEE